MSLRVGCWPGPKFDNVFIERFCESLQLSGIHIKSVSGPLSAAAQEIDVLHLHWPEMVFWGTGRVKGIFRGLIALIGLVILKSRRVKIVWTVHNLEPHDKGNRFMWFWRPYIFIITLLVDGFVTLCPSTIQIVRDTFPNLASKPATFLWHPDYKISEQLAHERTEMRRQLGVEEMEKVFAFIGQVRPYKGVEELLECFMKFHDARSRLLIAGSLYNEPLESKLRSSAAADSRIILHLGHLSEDDFAIVAFSADVIVLPFRKIFHSGSVVYALSAGKPVITPSNPFTVDLSARVGEGWMKLYDDVLLPEHLGMADVPRHRRPDLAFLSIAESGAKATAFYRSLLQS